MIPYQDRLPASMLLAVTLALAAGPTTGLGQASQFSTRELLYGPSLPSIFRTLAFDVDADGDLDLITSRSSGTGVRFTPQLGLNSREFGASVLLGDPLGTVPGNWQHLLSGDLDGDGQDDLVVVNGALDVVDVLWSDPSGLGAPERIHSGPRVPFEGVLMDLDLDGDLDVALPRTGTTTLSENFTWIENLGGRQFASPADFAPLDTQAVNILAGDVDGDGDDDLVTFEGQERTRFYRRDPAGFTLVQTVAGLSFGAGILLRDLIDLDLDGHLDLVVRSNLSTGALVPFVAPFDPATGEFSALAPLPGVPGNSSVFDVNADTIPDFVFLPGNGHPAEFFRGLGNLQYGGAEPLVQDSGSLGAQLIQADMDADGRPDLVTSGPSGLAWIPGAPPTTGPALEDEVRFISRQLLSATGIAAIPVNGDAYLDLVTGSSRSGIQRLDGTDFGTVGELSEFGGGLSGGSDEPLDALEGVDVDGDGLQDLFLRSRTGEVSWRRNLGGGAFGAPAVITQLAGSDRMLQVIDVDGDGDLDFVERTPRSTTLTWWEQEPGGTLLAPAALLTTINPIQEVSMGDHNGDGVEDLALTILLNGSRTRIRWLQGLGGGQFAAGQTLAQLTLAPGRFRSIDLNGDGRAEIGWDDISIANAIRIVQFLPSTGTFSAPGTFGPWGLNDTVYPKDFDGDGQGDLITIHRSLGTVRFYRGNGSLSFGAPSSADSFGGTFRGAETLDFDGDGDSDLLVWIWRFGVESATEIYLYRNEATGTPGLSYCGPAVPNSTGESAVIASRGSATITDMNLVLRTAVLPPGTTTFFLASRATDVVSQPLGSQGVLCLGGSIGRFVGPGQVLSAAQNGTTELALDLTDLPQPTGGVPAAAGETWYFQAWFRDSVAGQATSNFTDGLSLTFR